MVIGDHTYDDECMAGVAYNVFQEEKDADNSICPDHTPRSKSQNAVYVEACRVVVSVPRLPLLSQHCSQPCSAGLTCLMTWIEGIGVGEVAFAVEILIRIDIAQKPDRKGVSSTSTLICMRIWIDADQTVLKEVMDPSGRRSKIGCEQG